MQILAISTRRLTQRNMSISLVSLLWVYCVVRITSQQEVNCNETVDSMKKMLDIASQSTQSTGPNYMLCVELSEIEEKLVYSNISVPFSVFIRPKGELERCTLTCEEKDLPFSNYEEFPLIFKGSELVMIENINFIGCMRPVQMMWIKNIQLVNTTFRYYAY